MKKLFIILVIGIFGITSNIYAQSLIVEDTFDGNELSWTENTKPDLGECIIIDGALKFNSKLSSHFFDQKTNVPQLLLSEGVMPVDPAQGFIVSVDIEFNHMGGLFGTIDMLNYTSGILLEYDDDYNFVAVAINEKSCYILFYKEGKLVRYKKAAIKVKPVDKKLVNANLKIEYKDYKLKIFVDDIEMTELRKVNIESSTIALFATGNRKVSFDNFKVMQ